MCMRTKETSTNSYERPMYDYRFRLLCCYTQLDDQYFGSSMIEPYWTRDYKSTSGVFWDGAPYWSVSVTYTVTDGLHQRNNDSSSVYKEVMSSGLELIRLSLTFIQSYVSKEYQQSALSNIPPVVWYFVHADARSHLDAPRGRIYLHYLIDFYGGDEGNRTSDLCLGISHYIQL